MNETKRKLIDVAESLIRQKGVNGMSYQHLSKEVGIKTASIHYYFPKKEDLIESVINSCKVSYFEVYNSVISSDDSPINKMRRIAEVFRQGIESNKICVMGILSSEKESLNDTCNNTLRITILNTVELYATMFKEAKTKGSINTKQTDMDLAFAYYNLLIGGQIIGRTLQSTAHFVQSVDAFIEILMN